MSARQREPAGDGDTRIRFFLGAIAPPQAAEGAQFCKLPPETRACRKAAARGVQGKNQRRLRCAVKVRHIKLEGGTAAGMIGRWKQKRKAPARGRFTANAAYPFIRTNALRAYTGAHKTVILKITIMASVRRDWERNNGYLVKAGYPLFFCRHEKQ